MCGFLLRIIINAAVLYCLVGELPGIFIDTFGGTLLGATIIGIANAAVRPLLSMAAVPLNWLTLGGSAFVTNIFTPMMVVNTLPGVQISGAFASVAGILLITVCSATLNKVIQDR